jgi:hypothetical protein
MCCVETHDRRIGSRYDSVHTYKEKFLLKNLEINIATRQHPEEVFSHMYIGSMYVEFNFKVHAFVLH